MFYLKPWRRAKLSLLMGPRESVPITYVVYSLAGTMDAVEVVTYLQPWRAFVPQSYLGTT